MDAVPTLGATALQTPPGMFLERYHKQRRGPASLVTGGLIAAILALAPFGAITAQWINNITGINNDPAFDSRPGSGYFTVSADRRGRPPASRAACLPARQPTTSTSAATRPRTRSLPPSLPPPCR